MTPIHEMKTRKATWVDVAAWTGAVQCHGVFFEVDGREVGVVIRDQPEAVAKPLIEAIAALPLLIPALHAFLSDNGHTPDCGQGAMGVFVNDRACPDECRGVRNALLVAGLAP